MATTHVGSICATLAVAAAAWSVAVEPAQAQLSLWPQFRPWPVDHAPFRHKHRHRDANSRPAEKAPAQDVEKGPLHVVISIADQRISVYDDGALIARSSVSTGVPDHPTPSGIFSVISKKRWHRSNLYSDAPMPYMQRITWSGIALHAGVLPGYPASHGCIRLKSDFAMRLWHLTRRGTRVIIAPNDVRPVEIANPRLPQSKPKAAYTTAAAISDNTMIEVAGAPSLSTSADDPQPQQVTAPVPGSAQKTTPISILVSRKSNMLFVRHGFRQLFETPVTIRDPEEALGTHVFTLMKSPPGDAAFRWTVMSIPEGSRRAQQGSTKRPKSAIKHMVETTPSESSPKKANAALDRIEMPPDAVERIVELLTPGSTLIVSDYGISSESGPDTDFIVETR
jgi:lipoprotein-anchoring transpeptidase ErfK/SrfK